MTQKNSAAFNRCMEAFFRMETSAAEARQAIKEGKGETVSLDEILYSTPTLHLEALLFNAYDEGESLSPEYDDVDFWIEELIELDQLLRIWWR